MAIQVGSVEVDVIPNTQGIYQRLRDGIVPAATRAGQDAGNAAGRAFGPAMQSEIGSIGLRIGQQIGSQIAARIVAEIRGALRDGVTQGGAAARASAVRQGDQTGGAFSRALKTRLEAAFRALPKINIDADTTEADADLQALRVRMETLAGKRIGIDIDAEAAKAEIKLIEAELTRLGARHPNVQVRADTATALGELAAVRSAIDGVDGKRARIDVDTSGALSAVLQLGVAIGGLAAIPAVPVLAAGIGSIGSAAVAAAVGVGALAAVAAPAIAGIAGALQAQKAAQDAATASSLKGAQASGQGASKALQMAGAQQSLATAERNGARQIAQALKSVRDARQAAADAADQAAQRNAAAARAVQDAERSLAQSQKDAKQAQQDLTDARRQAALELEDLNSRLADAQLSQRDATLGVQEAQAELNRTMADAKSTQLDKDRAQLSYDQAVQRLKEQTTETLRLKGETAAANKAGVEGSDTVVQAQDRLAKAQQQVADRARGVRDAQAEAARTQVETARQVAQAQERVSEATANVAVAQQSAADAVSSAQRQIASASQSAAGGVDQAALAQAKYQAELAKLTPAARGTFNAFVSLKSAFSDWSESLQPQVMPLFTRALIGLKNSLPGLTPVVLAAARAIGTLQDRVSAGFKSPWWQTFKQDLAGSVEPAIVGLGASFGRIFKGMSGVVQAFLPHIESISSTMQRITGRFATWGTSLKGSPQFERFLSYAAEQGPVLARAIGDISSAFYQMARATAPLSGPVLTALGAVARAIADIARDLPWLIQLLYAVWVATKLWTLAMIAFNLVMNANPITLIIIGIVALVAAVVYAYKNFTWFRDVVNAVWEALKAGALFVWNNILKPVFDALVIGLKAIGTAASWLWNTILSPVFGFIGAAARILATVVLTILITPLVIAFKVLAAVGMWLWTNVFGPVFGWIADKAVWLWQEKIKPVWDLFKIGIGLLGAKLKELWDKYAKPVLGWIADKAVALWKDKIKPVWELFKIGIGLLGAKIKELWDKYAKPAFGWIADKGKWLWDKALKPAFDNMKKGVKAVGDSFNDAKDFIGKAWSKVQDIAKKPVRFIIDKIYNAGIVPTWNMIAKAFGAPKIQPMETKGWATGGVLPGYTPGRDVHSFYSPTGGGLELSGGEAIMRPEFTRAVGSGFVSTMNKIASSRGATGVKAALAPALGGNPTTQKFADGGIFGWIGKTVSGVGSKAWEGVKKTADWLKDGLEASARAGVSTVVNPLLAKFPGASGDFGKMVRKIPDRILDSLFGYSKKADTKGAGGVGGPKIQNALKWARTQAGLPYQWAGNGNPSWDCSGFMSAIESVIRGQKPHRRWATGAFSGKTAPPGWVLNAKSPFQIGITNAGVGHTAGTIGGVNVESRGGDGVVVGSRARGWNAPMFTSHYGFKPGSYDSGGYLQPGLSLAYNGTGRPEPVFTTQQANALMSGGGTGGLGDLSVKVFVGNEEISHIARAEVHRANGELVQVLNAGGGL
ncbi:hypothetical protein OOK39_02010 [Streptomyces sp. NBC_00264]|uniref:hypothetical protein n=1 Tax=unclassified Streptomyces TaxID=2593676 RepID=UPI00224FCB7E|nr:MULTISPECIES: hypothetical protein [unclassified Streptomyces]MCX5158076.1 hypothetical protein [Streptomyces sp. NBC_00305]MCX5216599.1 hypothetical protein [Streptomyces sp. NBC_00264]